ncbi:MAG: hypothetical protein COB02_11070 [Candidatus Cloacimonadota bacterium]|nr:MAG: hypothetical protein COB02_11070 [Candidatus Cloacimonadota bacterium]
MKFLTLLCLLAIASTSYAKSISYGVRSHKDSGSIYSPIPGKNTVDRYLYCAFQKGYLEGNMTMNSIGIRYAHEPQGNYNYVILERPGFSKLDIYFKKSAKYSVRTARLSILERLVGSQSGKLAIYVNGRNVISNHSPIDRWRFIESGWSIAQYMVDGMNHIEINLQSHGSSLALLGVKVETVEVKNSNGTVTQRSIDFVNRVFRTYHQRYPTSKELNYYGRLLDSKVKTTAQVRRMIRNLENDQFEDEYTELVSQYFIRYANRHASEQEKVIYSDKLRRGTMTLPQLRRECERLKGHPHTGGVSERIVRIFKEQLHRAPSTEELRYYRNRIELGSISWSRLTAEIKMLKEGVDYKVGLTRSDISRFDFDPYTLPSNFWKRLRNTTPDLLRQLKRKAQYISVYEARAERKNMALSVLSELVRLNIR